MASSRQALPGIVVGSPSTRAHADSSSAKLSGRNFMFGPSVHTGAFNFSTVVESLSLWLLGSDQKVRGWLASIEMRAAAQAWFPNRILNQGCAVCRVYMHVRVCVKLYSCVCHVCGCGMRMRCGAMHVVWCGIVSCYSVVWCGVV